MNRRTLVIGSTAVVALLLFGLTPKLVGMNLRETAITDLFALIPPEYERQLEINETSFSSGWFQSRAQFDIEYSALGLEDPLSMRLDFDFQHGPILLTGGGIGFGLAHARIIPSFNSQELTEAISDVPFQLPDLELNLMAGFDQSLTVELNVAPTSVSEAGVIINFEGLRGTLVAYNDRSAKITIEMGEFSAGEGVNGFAIESLDLDSRTEQLNNLLAPSSAEILIPRVSVTGIAAFTASDISALSRLVSTEGNDQQIDIHQKLVIANVESEFPLEALTWTSEIKELETRFLQNYYEMLGSLQVELANGSGTDQTPDLDTLMQEMLVVLIQNSLIFNNVIEATVYQGDHNLEVLISWLGLPQINNIFALTMEEIIASLEVEIHMSLDLEAIARSPFSAMIDPYVQQGYITLDNGRILLDMSLVDEQLTVNGEVIPLGNFSIQQNL